MRFQIALLLLALSVLVGCDGTKRSASDQSVVTKTESAQAQPEARSALKSSSLTQQNVSLNQADAANAASQAIERKIIRDANLTLEVASPTDVQSKIVTIAESNGGFVVTSETTQRTTEGGTKPETTVNLVVRVPAAQFNQAIGQIRALSSRIIQEKITGQDVTEEYIDLEARIKNQKALEAQFLEIMKRAIKVQDALDVQSQLADVRTEIERLEGRRRFLENQSSLSTITITFQPPTSIVSTTGFWYSIRSAFADGVDVAAAIVLFLIRAVVALLPVLVLIVLPAALITKLFLKRARRLRPAGSSDQKKEEAQTDE
jgi:hypothetical protein